jgi:ABC-type bacteriocin/lantibiotic exporter with double-glycine peptidase domain
MVLHYWGHTTTEKALAQLFGGTAIGTPSSRVQRLTQWGYRVAYRTSTLPELEAWLEQGIPPIVFVRTEFLDYWTENTPHAVVLVGVDEDRVYLHDPAFAAASQTCSLDGFLAAWVEQDEVVAVIQPA